jgi:catecholate siderophore receptor
MFATAASGQEALPQIDVLASGGGYQTINPSLARLPTPLLNTPQSVNVVPEKVIQEQNASNVKDALRNVAGITFRAGEGGNQGDSPYIRGFSAQSDVFRDGARDPGWYTRDNFTVDAVEVFKGPSAVLFGRGSAGGVINLTTKTPVDRTFVEGTVTGNSGPGVRATVDANGKINENVAARIQVMGQKYDIAGRDHVEENRYGVAPSVRINMGTQTTATLSYIFQHEFSVPDYGIPFLSAAWGVPRPVAPVPRNNWYGILSSPYPDVENVDAHIGTARLEHQFNSWLKATNITRYSNVHRFQRNVFPEPNTAVAGFPQPPSLNSMWRPNRAQVDVTNTILSNQTDFNLKFATGAWQHTVATGVDFSRETRDFQRNNFTGQGATNFITPDAYRAPGAPGPVAVNQLLFGQSDNAGVYFADQIKLNEWWELLGSVRYDSTQFTQDAPLAAASVRKLHNNFNFFSWRAGVVFHPLPNTSVYAMRGTSFNPSADLMTINPGTNPPGNLNALSLAQLGPETNVTTEAGAKADVLNGRLSLQTAVFQSEKTNMRVADPATSSFTVLQGITRVNGFEASATGKLTDQWSIITSYTYLDARIVQTLNAAQLGQRPVITPQHSFSLWTTYDVTAAWQIGGGAWYVGESWGDIPNTALIPAYWRFDAMTAYRITDKTTIQLNVYNLTDKFYAAAGYSNWIVPGASRTFALTLRTKI